MTALAALGETHHPYAIIHHQWLLRKIRRVNAQFVATMDDLRQAFHKFRLASVHEVSAQVR